MPVERAARFSQMIQKLIGNNDDVRWNEPAKLWFVMCISWLALGRWRKIEIHDLFRWLKTTEFALRKFQKRIFLKNQFLCFKFRFSAPYIKQCRSADPALVDCIKDSLHHLRPWLKTGIPEIQVRKLIATLNKFKTNTQDTKGRWILHLEGWRARSSTSACSNNFQQLYGQQH